MTEPTPFERLYGKQPQRGVEKAVWRARQQGWNAALKAAKDRLVNRSDIGSHVLFDMLTSLEQPT